MSLRHPCDKIHCQERGVTARVRLEMSWAENPPELNLSTVTPYRCNSIFHTHILPKMVRPRDITDIRGRGPDLRQDCRHDALTSNAPSHSCLWGKCKGLARILLTFYNLAPLRRRASTDRTSVWRSLTIQTEKNANFGLRVLYSCPSQLNLQRH